MEPYGVEERTAATNFLLDKSKMKPLAIVSNFHNANLVEPRFNELAGDRPTSFVKSRVRYIEILFVYILLLLGQRKPFVVSRFSLNRGC